MAERTAQNAFAEMMRQEMGPGLRALGFKGSAGRYVLPDDDRWQLAAFQKNRYSTSDEVTFTVNLTTADKTIWAATRAKQMWLPEQPSGNSEYPVDKTIVIRLGNLMPPRGEDRWWAVRPDRATNTVSSQVLEAIAEVGIPWLRFGRGGEEQLGKLSPRDIWRR